MASLPTRTTASFDAIKPVSSLVLLDDELNDIKGAAGFLNGGTSGKKLLVKTSDGADPPVDQDQIGAGLLARWKQNGSSKATITNDGSLTANGVTGAAGVYTFGSIPVGPASDPTTANQLARKQYVDDRVHFSFSFPIADPTVPGVSNIVPGSAVFVSPDGVSLTLTKSHVHFQSGSHTAGGSITFIFRRRTAASTWSATTDFGSVTLDNTNNTAFVVYTNDFADVTLAPGDTLTMYISARSGTVTERDVVVSVQGTR